VVQQAIAPYFGAQIKFSAERVYQDWSVEVLNDDDFKIRAMLEKWSNLMNTLISNRLDPTMYPTGYKGTAEVTQKGKDGRILRKYRFAGLWPMQIQEITLGWDAVAQIERFGVTFSLDYFEPIDHGPATDTYNPILPDDGNVSGSTGNPT
jgi:hypothetical protein